MDLDAELSAMLAAAHAAWPAVRVEDDVFFAHVASHIGADADREIFAELHFSDLYLACACASGAPVAIALLEEHFIREIDAFLGRMRLPRDLLDETKQVVRQKILIGSTGTEGDGDGRPRIAAYSGRGELRSWMRAAATRSALNVLRSRGSSFVPKDDELLEQPATGDDPETAALRSRYATDFKLAFNEAFALLTPRQRGLLRHHFLDGLSTEAVGQIYRVHRVTVLRWLGEARDCLAALTQKILMRRLGLGRSEFDSIVRLVRSQLDLSLNRASLESL